MSKNTVTVKMVGIQQLQQKLRRLFLAAKQDVVDAVKDSAVDITTDAKYRLRDWPAVDTGRLRSSIRPTYYQNGLTAEIGTNVEYAAFVEFGTGQRGSATLPTNMDDQLPDGWSYGSKQGMRARPYLHPAAYAAEKKFVKRVKEIIERNARKLR